MKRPSKQAKRQHQKAGQDAEALAATWLEMQGYQILHTNFRCRHGEIDVVAQDGEHLAFVEVRSLQNSSDPDRALATILPKKQQRLYQAARFYLYKHRPNDDPPIRFDLLGITFARNGELHFKLLKGGFEM